MSHILIVGRKFSSLTDYLDQNEHTYTVLQDVLTTKFPDKKFKNRTVVDFSSRKSVLAAVDALKMHVDGVMTVYENYILPTAWIADHLHLPGIPLSAAEACTDKYIMRSLFASAPKKISPGFGYATNEDDVRNFANSHSFPLILKPANLAKSLLVTRSNNLDELIASYRHSVDLLQTVYKKYAPNRTPKLIIEEFLEGNIYSVDAFVDSSGTPHVLDQIVDYQTGYDIGYDDNFHYSRLLPSALSPDDQATFRECAEMGIRALGIKNSAAHVEIIMTANGPRIVEIGARNGGYRERMHALANGIDILGAAVALALGELPSVRATKNELCAVLELFPKNPGTFVGISNIDSLRALPSLTYLSIKATEGTSIGKAADGYKMGAIIILHNTDSSVFNKDLEFVTDCVQILTN